MMQYAATAFIVTLSLANCAHVNLPDPPGAAVLKLAASVSTSPELVLIVNVENAGSESLAISDTWGFANGYFDIELESAHLPESQVFTRELFSQPPIRCIRPRQRFSRVFRLHRILRRYDGQWEKGDVRYGPLPAGKYKARVVYRAPDTRTRARCAPSGTTASEWIVFELLE